MKDKILALVVAVSTTFAVAAQTPVIVAVVEQKAIADEVEALGTLRANESVALTANVTEMITAVHFQDGQRVKRGDILIEMDDSEERAELAEEISRLQEAKKQVSRLSTLTATNASTESLLDEQQREVETAQARIQAAQSRIALRTIKAPFDGVLGLRDVSVGSLVQPGDTITTLDDDSVMKLDFSVPSVFLPVLGSKVPIVATSAVYPWETFTGEVLSVNSRIDPVTRSVLVRAIIDNPQRRLKPGLLMSVTIASNPRNSLVIPEEALVPAGKKHFVFKISQQNGSTTVTRQQIQLGARSTGEAEILSGLNAGDQVVTHGTSRVTPGSEVSIAGIQQQGTSVAAMIKTTAKQSG